MTISRLFCILVLPFYLSEGQSSHQTTLSRLFMAADIVAVVWLFHITCCVSLVELAAVRVCCCRYPQVVSPSTWSIVLRVNATCAYTWRATFAHLEPMHSLTAAPCPIISGYGSKVKDRITCRSIGSGSPRPRLLMNAINCHCSAKYEACKEANGVCRRLKLT